MRLMHRAGREERRVYRGHAHRADANLGATEGGVMSDSARAAIEKMLAAWDVHFRLRSFHQPHRSKAAWLSPSSSQSHHGLYNAPKLSGGESI